MGKFAASVDANLDKHEERLDLILRQASQDMMADIKIGPSITRSGHRVHGTIPRDDGVLAGSLVSSLQGATSIEGTGTASFEFVIAGAEMGDTLSFGWGGAAADYVLPVHYGTKTTKGTFWVDVAASKWPTYVSGAVAKAKAMVP